MEQSAIEIWLTRIGALTGFVAFLFKAYEFYRDRRPSLWISCSFTSDPERGNTIIVLNSSKVGTTIHYYTLEALPHTLLYRLWPRFSGGVDSMERLEFSLEKHTVNIDVPAHGQATLSFTQLDHFDWEHTRKDDLYLRLWAP